MTGGGFGLALAAIAHVRYLYRVMRARRSALRSPLALVLAGLALGALLLAASATHVHRDDAPAIYNPECQLLALATLGGSVALVASVAAVAVTLVAAPAVAVSLTVAPSTPRRHRDPRAPPASIA